jgi:hypothetical protein
VSYDPEKDKPIYDGEASFAPYPLSVSSPQIKPEDKRLVKGTAYEAMQYQANQQIALLRKQAELILQQVKAIEERVQISQKIYEADMRFTPTAGETYHLYRKNGKSVITMVSPDEWGATMPYDEYIASMKLLADKTWEILNKNENAEI